MEDNSKKVVRAGIGYTVGNYLLKGINFFTLPFLARILSTSDYGKYNTFIAYESLIFIIIELAIHTSYKNARYKFSSINNGISDVSGYNAYVSDSMLLILINSVLYFLLLLLVGKPLQHILGLDPASLLLLVIYSFSTAVFMCFNTYCSIDYYYKTFLIVSLVSALLNFFISLLLITTAFSENKYVGRILGITLPSLTIAICIIIGCFKRSKPKKIKEYLGWGIKYSLPIVPHGISQVILSQFDRIMINSMVNSAFAGIYSFAYNIFSIMNVTSSSLDNVWVPWFYEEMHKDNYAKIKKISSYYIIFMSIFSIIIILVSPELVIVLGSEKYRRAVSCVIPIVAAGFFLFLCSLPTNVEYYYEKTGYIAIATACAAVINIVLNYIFILKINYVAAAYTTLITYLLYFIFHYFLAHKITGRFIFSNKVITISSLTIAVFSTTTLLFIEKPFIRYCLCTFVVTISLSYDYKHSKMLKKIIAKLKY